MFRNVSINCRKPPRIIEKQVSLQCGKHAINNLLQIKGFATCKGLSKIAETLSELYGIEFNDLVDRSHGYYDASVLQLFLLNNGFDADTFHSSSNIVFSNSTKCIGYIAGNGAHWVGIRITHPTKTKKKCYFLVDSVSETPVKLDLRSWLKRNPQEMLIEVSRI